MSKTISTIQTSSETLSSSDTPLIITATGGIEVVTGSAIFGPAGQGATIINAGTVAGGSTSGGVGIDLKTGGTIVNAGAISGDSYGIRISGGVGTVTNTGTILSRRDGVVLFAGGGVANLAGGVISGTVNVGVYISGGTGTLTNAGTIIGASSGDAVQFVGSFANQVIVDAGAVFSGLVVGGSGNNTLELAAGSGSAGTLANLATQFVNFGIVDVDAGATWTLVNAGSLASGSALIDSGTLTTTGPLSEDGSLTLVGGAASNAGLLTGGSLTNLGTLTLTGQAEVEASGTSSAQHFSGLGGVLSNAGTLTNTGTVLLDGAGGGAIQSPGGTGGTLANLGILINAGRIALGGGKSGVLAASGGGGQLVDLGLLTNTGTIILAGGGVKSSNGYGGGLGAGVLVSGTLDNAGTVAIGAGAVGGSGPGLAAALTVGPSATLAGAGGVGGGGSLINHGTIDANGAIAVLNLFNDGTIAASATLSDIGTLVNAGNISATVNVATGATLVNTGQITAGAEIGVVLASGDLVINGGTGATAALISGNDGIESAGGGTVVNDGTINGLGTGIYLTNGGIVLNGTTGSTAALITGGVYGVYLPSRTANIYAPGTVFNSGTIVGMTGVKLSAAGTLTNSGTIIGVSNAVSLAGNLAHRVIVDPGAVFVGTVLGGSGSNTLQLAAGNGSAGTLSNLGTQFVGFGSIAVDAGATWTLVNPGSLQAGSTLADSGVLTTSGSLTNSATIGGAGTFMNLGSIAGAGTIAVSHLFNTGSLAVSLKLMDVGTLVNAGSIATSVNVGSGNTLVNTGQIIAGSANGVVLSSADLVTNGNAGAPAALISGYHAIHSTATGNTIANYGTLIGVGAAIDLTEGGSLFNGTAGSNAALIKSASRGVYIEQLAGTVVNAGTIAATNQAVYFTAGGAVTNTGTLVGDIGVVIAAGAGTLTNAGTISGSGGYAAQFNGAFADRVILEPGAVFSGLVAGGTGNNILELAAGGFAPGTLANVSSEFLSFGTISVDPGAVWAFDASDVLDSSTSVTNAGTIAFSEAAGSAVNVAASISGTGGLIQLGAGTLLLDGADSFTGGITIAGGTLELSAANGAGSHAISFAGDPSLRIDGAVMPTGTLYGFVQGDTIDLAGAQYIGVGRTTLTTNNLLVVNEAHATYQLQLDPSRNFAGMYFHLAPDGGTGTDITTDTTPCFCPGTRIRTDRGEIPVELLAIGDRVVTHAGVLKPIRWIGRRSYAGRFLAGKRHILPIRIKAGALADAVPVRDLWLSPLHALFIDGALIPAGKLVNNVSVLQEDVREVHYLHIELSEHDVLWAEGAPAESFVDDDSRAMFHNAHEYAGLYPDASPGLARYCAPRLEDGHALAAVRQRLDARAGIRFIRPARGALRGYLDRATDTELRGWAQDIDHPEAPVCLDVLIDGQLAAHILAGDYRADLSAAGLGSGQHSFSWHLPAPLTPDAAHVIEVRRSADGQPLRDSPFFLPMVAKRPSQAA